MANTIHGHDKSRNKSDEDATRRFKAHHGCGRKLNQMRKTQFRAKSGAAIADEEEIVVEEIGLAEFSGNCQATADKVRRKQI